MMSTGFQPLAATPMAGAREDLVSLFWPFVDHDRQDPRHWNAEVRRRRYKLLKRWSKGRLGLTKTAKRDASAVFEEYERAWSERDHDAYSLEPTELDYTPWLIADRRVFASDLGATRFRQKMLISVIEHLRPASVLEIGCGNGINLILLACRFPDIRFAGIELTASGHHAALSFQERHATLPGGLRDFAPEPLSDLSAFKNISFFRGSAAELPFDDGQFQLVQTVLALEQMEAIRDTALSEMARVTSHWAFNIEPFADANRGFWSKIYVSQWDYFRGRIDDLLNVKLEPQWATMDFPQEVFLKASAVLSSRTV